MLERRKTWVITHQQENHLSVKYRTISTATLMFMGVSIRIKKRRVLSVLPHS